MTSRLYDSIDEKVAHQIKRLHREHRKLGHHGLLEALRQQNIHVEPSALETFMKRHRIRPERPWRPWRWRGAPRWLVWFAAADNNVTPGITGGGDEDD